MASEKFQYFYDANGTKLRNNFYEDNRPMTTTDYSGPFVYTGHHPDHILTSEGRLKWDDHDNMFYPEYFIKDHLGNVRVVLTTNPNFTNPTIQVTDYYPFGLEFQDVSISDNRNLYNSKELQTDAKLWWYDYGARFYDPVIGRWHVVDPAAALYYGLSPYHYGGNSPVNTIDIDGRLFVYVNGFMVDQWWAGKQSPFILSHSGNTLTRSPNYSEYNPDRNFYTDGPRNAGKLFENDYWFGIPRQFAEEFKDKNRLFTNGSFYPSSSGQERFGEGYSQAQNLIAMLDNGIVTLSDGETIKIVGHSHGAAYAAGLATALLENPRYKHLVEFVVYIAPDQPNQFKHPEGVPGYQFSTKSDWVSSTGPLAWLRNSGYKLIEGAEWIAQREKYIGSRGGHGADSWVWEIVNWARSYGIPVNVYY